jgi:hypothetical protein
MKPKSFFGTKISMRLRDNNGSRYLTPLFGVKRESTPSFHSTSRTHALEYRRGHRTAMIHTLDPDHLLHHEPERPRNAAQPPEPDSDDSGNDSPMEHYASPKKQSRRSSRRRAPTAAHYASSASSFRGGTAVNAFCATPTATTHSRYNPLSSAWTRTPT